MIMEKLNRRPWVVIFSASTIILIIVSAVIQIFYPPIRGIYLFYIIYFKIAFDLALILFERDQRIKSILLSIAPAVVFFLMPFLRFQEYTKEWSWLLSIFFGASAVAGFFLTKESAIINNKGAKVIVVLSFALLSSFLISFLPLSMETKAFDIQQSSTVKKGLLVFKNPYFSSVLLSDEGRTLESNFPLNHFNSETTNVGLYKIRALDGSLIYFSRKIELSDYFDN